jgi:signal transduction histidine kinase
VRESALNKVSFRARVLKTTLDGKLYIIQIATSLEELDEEIMEVVLILIVGLTASALLLILISYFIAGKILEPIKTINRLTIDINERTLNKRIPLGKSHDELHQLSQSLNRMFDRLQLSFIRQKQFIASASHELKTPISMLRMFMDNAISQQEHPEPFKQQLIDQEAILIRMERMVKTLLNLSAMELKEALEIKNFNLTKVIRTILHDFSPVITANNIQLDVRLSDNVCMAGNQDKIRLMLINILDNAIKYNYKNGTIKLVVSETGDTINISLYNTGPGIPSQDRDKIFEQFYRVEKSRSLQYGGTGLGLTIVRQIVKLHKGSVKVESEPESWTRIMIELPKKQ